MKTCKILRRTIAALLLVVTCLALCPSAFAFDLDQYYVADYSLTQVYTVQIAASKSLSSSESVRDKMLRAGFDCFVYQYEGKYRIMCGKFYDYSDAEAYQKGILNATSYSHAYINNAWLPLYAVDYFQNVYYYGYGQAG